jgi:hypothetical protein
MKLRGLKLLDGVNHANKSPGCSWIGLVAICVSVIAIGYEHGYKSVMAIGGLMLLAVLRMGYKAFVAHD